MNTIKPSNKTAFTLIELLVVIAIIGLLSTISIVALNRARSKARDSRRVADMHQLVNAIDMYYDIYGEYPPLADNDAGSSNYDRTSDGVFMPNLVSAGLIGSAMEDPWNDRNYFYYHYFGAGSPYLTSYCPASPAQRVIHFALESNSSLTGFAIPCGPQSVTTGYIRCICLY